MKPPAGEPAYTTSVLLFTDVVDSTVLTQQAGDAAFRERSRALEDRVRRIVRDRHGTDVVGRTLGDGVLAMFTSAEQAIDAAIACASAGADVGLGLHIGLHAGDVLHEGDNVYGVAVNIASRISALAAPDEVLVSDVIRSLARASTNVSFEDRGKHTLKGIAEPQRLFAVHRQAAAGAEGLAERRRLLGLPARWLLAGAAALLIAVVAVGVSLALAMGDDDAGSPGREAVPSAPQTGDIAFVSDRQGKPDIYVMDADGSGLAAFGQVPGFSSDLAWSPDGRSVAFTGTQDPDVAGGGGDNRQEGDGGGGGGANGGDGQEENRDIYVMRLDGSAAIRLTNEDAEDLEPAWSRDGARLAFTSRRDGDREIYVMSADGTGQTRVTSDPADDFHPAWSPDGSRIAFTSARDGNREIYTMNADGSDLLRLTTHEADDFQPAWSPDGSRIAFASGRDGNREVYIVNADGSALVRLTSHREDDFHPAWSPDGTLIAFSSERDGNREIYMMNADGSGLIRLTENAAEDSQPVWSARAAGGGG